MVLILLEALGALLALVLIVWWTMFSGRRNGELPDQHDPDVAAENPPPAPSADTAAPQKPRTPPPH
ncbi:MAG: hypothetical protein H6930_08825 [Rhodoferax sp.]|jgi:hypothetical protein|nr:hypothetical protein [Rhodoferax sp.]